MTRPKPAAVLRFIFQSSKRIAVTVIGGVLVLGGIAMLVLPGPGLLVVVAGFAVLGTEYAWAAAALERTKRTAEAAGAKAKQVGKQAIDTGTRATKSAVDTGTRAGRSVADAGKKVVRPRRRPDLSD